MRAGEHGREVAEAIASWTASAPFRTHREYSDDRLAMRIVADEFEPAPDFGGWGMVVGDCVHNLRAALDNLVFAAARQHHDPPANPDLLNFPICKDTQQYKSAMGRIRGDLSDTAQGLIEHVQPLRNVSPEADLLWILHRLDIDDKHKIPSVVSVLTTEFKFDVKAQYEDEAAARRNPPDVTFCPGPIVPGLVMYEHRAKDPIKTTEISLSGSSRVMLETTTGLRSCGELLLALCNYVWSVFDLFRRELM